MYAVLKSFGLKGLNGFPVEVEADISGGMPALSIVGLPDSAVRESGDRVHAALKNLGFKWPDRRITINLAPADVRKTGPVYETGKAAALSEVCESFTKERCGSAMYRIFEFADVIEAMLTMKAETMGISDGTWFAVLEGQPLTVTVKDGTVTVTREAHPGADVLNREQAQELLLSPLASKGSKVPSEIWKNIPSDWFPLPLYCATADEF